MALASTPPERASTVISIFCGAITFTGLTADRETDATDDKEFQAPKDFYPLMFTDRATEFQSGENRRTQMANSRSSIWHTTHHTFHYRHLRKKSEIQRCYHADGTPFANSVSSHETTGLIDDTWKLSRDPKVERILTSTTKAIHGTNDGSLCRHGRPSGSEHWSTVQYLESTDQFDNTLILFFSDNGAVHTSTSNTRFPVRRERHCLRCKMGKHVQCTARLYKQYAHEVIPFTDDAHCPMN